jgi:uncharacterized protein YjlB
MKNFISGVLLPENTGVYFLDDDGVFPNNEQLPVVYYEHAFQISNGPDAALDIERLILENNWHHPWRNGVYDYHHYHSTAHEVLICYEGSSRLRIGGPSGVIIEFKQGDVLLLPAGSAHKSEEATADFRCIGAYPTDQLFDMNYGHEEERTRAKENIRNVALPSADPVYGPDGPLIFHWHIQVPDEIPGT